MRGRGASKTSSTVDIFVRPGSSGYDLPDVINCLFHVFSAAPSELRLFLSPDLQFGTHCLMICVIQLWTLYNFGGTWRRTCSPDIWSVSALGFLRNRALQIDIYLLTYKTNYDRRPSFRRRGTSSMEQSSSVRHRLPVSWHLQKISLDLFVFTVILEHRTTHYWRYKIVSFTLHYITRIGTVENHGKKWRKTRHTFEKIAKITAKSRQLI